MATDQVHRVRRLIDGLRRDRRAHPRRGRREYSQRARQVAAACEALLATEPAAVPALTQRAIERITSSLMYMDDSNGAVGGDLHGLMRLHARACSAAPPNPKRLADWLAGLRLDGPGWPDFELGDFAGALGESGRTELARIVEDRAATAQPDVLGGIPFGIRILREQLAEISGDVDQHVAVLAQNLRSARQYLAIVDALRAAGRDEDAERWAHGGLTELGNPIDKDRLRDTYVDLLLARGADSAALDLRHELFDAHPTGSHYRDLRRTAERTGDWPDIRDRAIERLHDAALTQAAFVDHLIGVLLDEDRHDQAWQTAADHAAAVPESRWQQLIELRRPSQPHQVIEPLQRLIEQRLDAAGDKYRYQRAITLIRRLREAYHATDDHPGFDRYLDDLRARHRRKTALLAKLEDANLAGRPSP